MSSKTSDLTCPDLIWRQLMLAARGAWDERWKGSFEVVEVERRAATILTCADIGDPLYVFSLLVSTARTHIPCAQRCDLCLDPDCHSRPACRRQ